jgi:hypothetical protein
VPTAFPPPEASERGHSACRCPGNLLFAEAVNYMVDHGIRVAKDGGLIDPVRKAIEAQHDEIHNAMRSFEDVGPEYQEL